MHPQLHGSPLEPPYPLHLIHHFCLANFPTCDRELLLKLLARKIIDPTMCAARFQWPRSVGYAVRDDSNRILCCQTPKKQPRIKQVFQKPKACNRASVSLWEYLFVKVAHDRAFIAGHDVYRVVTYRPIKMLLQKHDPTAQVGNRKLIFKQLCCQCRSRVPPRRFLKAQTHPTLR